jgi:hypothetical protein
MCITCKGQILGLIQAGVVNRLSRFCKILSPQTENRELTTRHWFLSSGYERAPSAKVSDPDRAPGFLTRDDKSCVLIV